MIDFQEKVSLRATIIYIILDTHCHERKKIIQISSLLITLNSLFILIWKGKNVFETAGKKINKYKFSRF